MNLFPSPFLLMCPPALARDTGVWTTRLYQERGRVSRSLTVQRTRFVKSVNNRLLSRTGQRGEAPFPPGQWPAVYFACCIRNPLVVVAFFFFKQKFPSGKGGSGGQNGEGSGRGRRPCGGGQYGWRPGQPSGSPWASVSPCGPGNRPKHGRTQPSRLIDRQS